MLHLYRSFARQGLAVLSLWLFLTGNQLFAQPVLVKDINTSKVPYSGGSGSGAQPLFSLNGAVYFMATDSVSGRELWKTDGTPGGTTLVRDIFPGPANSSVNNFTRVNNTVYFTEGRTQIWKTDGTTGGTALVKNILPEVTDGYIYGLAGLNGTLYFLRDDGSNGIELWKSDGTAAGTSEVKQVTPGFASVTVYTPLVNVGGVLYFTANDGTHGVELWKTNGTAAGTVMVKDIAPEGNGSFPEELTGFNGTLYFRADNGSSGYELFRSDGTAAGTVLVKDIFPGSNDTFGYTDLNDSAPSAFTNVNGTLYFSAADAVNGRELWKTNGTAAGTVLVKDIIPGSGSGAPQQLVSMNNTLYFSADDGVSGRELWKSNGTGTALIKDLRPGADTGLDPYYPSLTPVNNVLYFSANSGDTGSELWKSDGTAAGTALVKDIQPGTGSGKEAYSPVISLGATIFFMGNDGNSGEELWKSDGTAAGTTLVKDIGSPRSPLTESSAPVGFTNVNGTLYFVADNGVNGYELWKSNGTAAGTVLVKDIGPFASPIIPGNLTNLNGTLYFGAHGGLWKTDGTATGTVLVKNVIPQLMINANGTLYFSANGALWKSDGTTAGTVLVKDGITPSDLINVNGVIYFVGTDAEHGAELWKSNGTAAGTVLVKDIRPDPSGAGPFFLTNFNGTVYFSANDEENGREFWKSDGTEAGTVMANDLFPGVTYNRFGDPSPNSSGPGDFTNVNGTLYFTSSSDFDGGRKLWRMDGTSGGLVLLKEVYSYLGNPYLDDLVNVNGTLFFVASDPEGGKELWKTTGTAAGTVRVKDIAPGTTDSSPFSFAVVGNTLYFVANDVAHGQELYRSDGTAAGTVLIRDILPGTDSPLFEQQSVNLTNVNGTLFFAARDNNGQELWKYNATSCVNPNVSLAVPPTVVCASSPATVTVKASQPGVSYGIYYGLSPVTRLLAGTGGDLTFTIPAASIASGANTFSVKAIGCIEVTLTQAATVTVLPALSAPTADGKTVAAGQTATLTASGAPAGVVYRWYAAATGGTPLATGTSFKTPALTVTTSYYVAGYQSNCPESARTKVTVTVAPSTAGSFRVNAGGSAFATADGRGFTADGYFQGGNVSTPVNNPVAGTDDDYLYQTGRHGASFSYNFPAGNGNYDVVLHFSETWWGNQAPGGAGSRKFNVDIEGGRKLTEYDIYQQAGGALRVKQETFRVAVTDGVLNLVFTKGSADVASIKAIEILPANSAFAINAGGNAFTAAGGKAFSADSYFASGVVSGEASGEVLNTPDDYLYRTGRHGSVFSYGLPTGNGTYDVVLHFAETWWGYKVPGGAGSRKFNVDVEGQRKLTEYDIFVKAGGAMRAVRETIRVTVTDGVLNLLFSKGSADLASIKAIEVVPVSAASARTAAEPEEDQTGVILYPNPAEDKLFVQIAEERGPVSVRVTDAAGKVVVEQPNPAASNRFVVEVSSLKKGLYLLQLQYKEGYRVLKFVKK